MGLAGRVTAQVPTVITATVTTAAVLGSIVLVRALRKWSDTHSMNEAMVADLVSPWACVVRRWLTLWRCAHCSTRSLLCVIHSTTGSPHTTHDAHAHTHAHAHIHQHCMVPPFNLAYSNRPSPKRCVELVAALAHRSLCHYLPLPRQWVLSGCAWIWSM
jgi:hypothetical protein